MLSKVEKELGSKGVVALLARVTNKPKVLTTHKCFAVFEKKILEISV